MTEPSNESCPKTVGDVLAELEIQSDAHHKELAGKFLGLSIAVSFGSLAYLISLETLLPPATSESPLAIQISWCATYLSAILGSLHLWLEMLLPRHAYNAAKKSILDVGLFLCSWCLFCENLRENDQTLACWQFVSTCRIVDEHGGLVAVGLGEFLD